jgi:hypothetical protein
MFTKIGSSTTFEIEPLCLKIDIPNKSENWGLAKLSQHTQTLVSTTCSLTRSVIFSTLLNLNFNN